MATDALNAQLQAIDAQSRFLTILPRELRDEVYDLLLQGTLITILHDEAGLCLR